MIVAIDGPAGAGKSTVARLLAERLGFRYLDTGAMYRALTWLALRAGFRSARATRLGELAARAPDRHRRARPGADRRHRRHRRDPRARGSTGSCPWSRGIPRCGRSCASVSGSWREEGDAVIEGRDIGTVVAPDAAVKVYLVADTEVRARRRQADRPDIGADALATDLRLRDESDAARMQPAADAELIDTTELEVDEVVARVEELVARAPRSLISPDHTWAVGRITVARPVTITMRLHVYGRDRIPLTGGVVLAMNHFSWGDAIAFGVGVPTHDPLHGQVGGRPHPRPRPADAARRRVSDPPRRVRP